MIKKQQKSKIHKILKFYKNRKLFLRMDLYGYSWTLRGNKIENIHILKAFDVIINRNKLEREYSYWHQCCKD